jgi:hypothetical protein
LEGPSDRDFTRVIDTFEGALMTTIRCRAAIAVCVVGLVVVGSAYARYIRPQLEQVPVAQLVENLEKAIQAKPKDATLRFNLARVHGMAYALKTEEAEVNTRISRDSAWFGYEPKFVPFALKMTDDEAKRKAAKDHLDKAIKRYDETVTLAPDNLAARLGLAWTTEQAGAKEKAVTLYRDVIERGWKKEKVLKTGPLGGHYITAEAAGYLIPLLNPEKDGEEIATLKERAAALQKLPRPVTPIAIPLRGGLTARDLVDQSARVAFDADGSGIAQRWTWLTKDAGWLVYDRRGKAEITSGLQLFGNCTFWLFWDNGYQALAALDDNGDGVLTGNELKHLAVWVDRNGDGVVQPGEVTTLAELNIVALSCRHEIDLNHSDYIAWSRAGVVFRDGTTRPTFDLILHRR